MVISLFSKLQIFYQKNSETTFNTLQDLYKANSSINSGRKLIIFYEKIRTNGKGTLKVDKILA